MFLLCMLAAYCCAVLSVWLAQFAFGLFQREGGWGVNLFALLCAPIVATASCLAIGIALRHRLRKLGPVVFSCLLALSSPFWAFRAATYSGQQYAWVRGFALRVQARFDIHRAREWSRRYVLAYTAGDLRTEWQAAYEAPPLSAILSTDIIPDFITQPWVRRPVVGIMDDAFFVTEPSVCLSWYTHFLILGKPSERVMSLPRHAIHIIDEDCFIYNTERK